jgi:hypothetical protein
VFWEKLLVVALAAALLTAGCLGSTSPGDASIDEAEADDEARSMDRFTRANLTEGQVVLNQTEPGWQAVRINLTEDLWGGSWDEGGGEAHFELSLVVDPGEGAQPVLGVGFQVPGLGDGEPFTYVPFFALNETGQQTRTLDLSLQCQSSECPPEPPRIELATIFGTMEGQSRISIGIPSGQARDAASDIVEREPLNVQPAASGDAILAGTHAEIATGDEKIEWTSGRIAVTDTGPTPRPAGVQALSEHRMSVDAEWPSEGFFNGLMGGFDSAEATTWSADWNVPPEEGNAEGEYVRAGPASEGSAPVWAGQLASEPGSASFKLAQNSTGKQDPSTPAGPSVPLSPQLVLGTWGWVDVNLFEAFDWSATEFAEASQSRTPDSPGSTGVEIGFCQTDACIQQTLVPGQAPIVEAHVHS